MRHVIPRPSTKATWAIVLVLTFSFIGGDTLGGGSVPVQAARPHLFNIYTWHLLNFPVRWAHTARQAAGSEESPRDAIPAIDQYFRLAVKTSRLSQELVKATATGDAASRKFIEHDLATTMADRDALKYRVERAMEDMISEELISQGITSRVLFKDMVWPPVYFRLSEMPRVLVVSPRDHIEIMETHLLMPDMTLADIERLEQLIENQGLSSVVQNIDGVATYPSMVPDTDQLASVLEEASHEWAHQYLYFHPLGKRYWASGEMTILNETVADLTGRELGSDLYKRFFAEDASSRAVRAGSPRTDAVAAAALSVPFDFNAAMRETRIQTEALLAAGRVDDAEGYMEQRRQMVVEQGYYIRKLNQAYFAFHGNYAERAGSVNPIGGRVRAIRNDSPTLKAFLERVSLYTSMPDLRKDYDAHEALEKKRG